MSCSQPMGVHDGGRKPLALVTGGGGFLGGAVARGLLARGYRVRSFSRGIYPDLEKAGIKTLQGCLSHADAVLSAVKDCDIVFHIGAKAGVWGPYEEYYQTNVVGTEHVLAACRKHGVSRLVYTSSPSVVFNGKDLEGANESLPYPETFSAHYPATKAAAEKKVIAANGKDLATVSLRPHLIWGPGDNHLVPRIVARGKTGQLRKISGPAKKVDSVYIDNAAEAHLLAADRLFPGSEIAGKVYFVSNGEPLPVWELVDKILLAAGESPVEKSISPGAAYAAGFLLETVYGMLGIRSQPRMTRFLAKELSTAHWFDISAARRDLEYNPKISLEEGFRRLRASYARPTPE